MVSHIVSIVFPFSGMCQHKCTSNWSLESIPNLGGEVLKDFKASCIFYSCLSHWPLEGLFEFLKESAIIDPRRLANGGQCPVINWTSLGFFHSELGQAAAQVGIVLQDSSTRAPFARACATSSLPVQPSLNSHRRLIEITMNFLGFYWNILLSLHNIVYISLFQGRKQDLTSGNSLILLDFQLIPTPWAP